MEYINTTRPGTLQIEKLCDDKYHIEKQSPELTAVHQKANIDLLRDHLFQQRTLKYTGWGHRDKMALEETDSSFSDVMLRLARDCSSAKNCYKIQKTYSKPILFSMLCTFAFNLYS